MKTGQFTESTSGTYSDCVFNNSLIAGEAQAMGSDLWSVHAFAADGPDSPLTGPLSVWNCVFQPLGLIRIMSIHTQRTGGRVNAL